MTEIPAENYARPWAADTRDPLPLVGDARHDGHADLLRERIDGATGY